MKNKFLYYFLSFTWGILYNLLGLIVLIIFLILGKKPKIHKRCLYFEIGKDWGGVNFGFVFVTCKNATEHTRNHEYGHSIQNCWWGPLFVFVIAIPSFIRYWYRELKYYRKGKYPTTDYDDIWFEGQATKLGYKF